MTDCFSLLGERPLRGRECLQAPFLTPNENLAVKAGIGGFYLAKKQLTGKACNGVLVE